MTALGTLLSTAAASIAARTQAPEVLAAHHLLTLAAMAAQRLVSVRLPTGALRPASCYVATFVGAGEGRSALVKAIVEPLRAQPAGAGLASSAHALDFVELRRPGANDRYRSFRAQSALFADHGEAVIARGRMRRVEAAGLADLWEGRRAEAASILTKPVHARLSLHLVTTPREGFDMFTDPALADAGLLGRLLVAAPPSCVGDRVWVPGANDDLPPELTAFHVRVKALTAREATAHTRVLTFTAAAASQWLAFAQEVEAGMREAGAFASIRPLAGELAEHAARLAAVTAFLENDACPELDELALARGITLARFYAAEALRITRRAPALEPASEATERLQHWLERTHAGRSVTLRDVCRLGPTSSRDADVAYRLMRRLERLGFVEPKTTSTPGAGVLRRVREPYCWTVRSAAAASQDQVSQDVA